MCRYLKQFLPGLDGLGYDARNAQPESFEVSCNEIGVTARYQPAMGLKGYDTILMLINTVTCLVDDAMMSEMARGVVLASLCTTSQTGEIQSSVYGRDDV